MNKMQEQVKEFMIPGLYPIHDKPITDEEYRKEIIINKEPMSFYLYLLYRRNWIKEECDELTTAILARDTVEITDALADLLYFVFGTAVSIGVDLEPFFDLVHKANMDKFFQCPSCSGMGKLSDLKICTNCFGGGIIAKYRKSDGKLAKPDNWKHPNLKEEMERQKNG